MDTVETNLISATSETVVTEPRGWLFSRIAGILSTDYEIPNPRLSARDVKPNEMWPMGGIQKCSDRSKVFDRMSPSYSFNEESLKLTPPHQYLDRHGARHVVC